MKYSNRLANNLRNKRFWLWDRIHGGQIRNHLDDVNSIQLKRFDDTKEVRLRYLRNIMQHATNTCPYYFQYKSASSLEQLPVVDKNIVRNDIQNFLSVETQRGKDKTVSTSGSTGTPFSLTHNKDKVRRSTADNLYFYNFVGYRPGDPIYYFRFWSAFERKSFSMQQIQNITPIDVFDMDDVFIEKLLLKLRKEKCKVTFLGYPSAFARMCEYLQNNKPDYKVTQVKAIVAISESLNEHLRTLLAKYFGIKPVSRYSNVENGIVAQEPPDSDYFVVNNASYYLEILNEESDQPLPYGETGRIIVTDLFNRSLPLIRYDTGDVGALEIKNRRLVLTEVHGRRIDQITDTRGNKLRGNIVLIIHKYTNVRQCQIIQRDSSAYTIKLNTNSRFNEEKSLLAEYRQYLGQDAQIQVEYVNEIPLLASGKMRVLVNDFA